MSERFGYVIRKQIFSSYYGPVRFCAGQWLHAEITRGISKNADAWVEGVP